MSTKQGFGQDGKIAQLHGSFDPNTGAASSLPAIFIDDRDGDVWSKYGPGDTDWGPLALVVDYLDALNTSDVQVATHTLAVDCDPLHRIYITASSRGDGGQESPTLGFSVTYTNLNGVPITIPGVSFLQGGTGGGQIAGDDNTSAVFGTVSVLALGGTTITVTTAFGQEAVFHYDLAVRFVMMPSGGLN